MRHATVFRRITRLTATSVLVSVMIFGMLAPTAFSAVTPAPPNPTTQPAKRTRAQVEALIAEAGRTPPAWWDSVQPNYPKTLDLTWNNTGKWENQRNMGQFIWDVIDPNPGRWREGVKLVHTTLNLCKDNPKGLEQAINSLGRMYGHLLEDYARAAFWGRKGARDSIMLANCYWKLGCREMAVEMLQGIQGDPTRNCSVVKLWAEMGEVDRALRIAEDAAHTCPDAAYLAAGDACRGAGRYKQALDYYQKSLTGNSQSRANDLKMNHERALASSAAIVVFDMLDLSRIADGKYTASSFAYTGPLEVMVSVKAGRIEDVRVTKHSEKQFYSSIIDTTRQIIAKQGVKGVDATAGASITSEAIINATAKALASAMKAGK